MKLKLTCTIAFIFLLMTFHASGAQESWCRFRHSAPLMGTSFTLTFYATSGEHADSAAFDAFERIKELNAIFSDYAEDSEVTKLSNTAGSGRKVSVSQDLWYLLNYARNISKQSRGAFDITIGPLTRLWRRGVRQNEIPDPAKIKALRRLVNYRWVKLYPRHRKVKLKKAGMRLDFGGIAKGYAVDEAYKVLKNRYGITSALVDGGGDLFVADPPPDNSTWQIKNADGTGLSIQHHSAIASSGDTYRFLQWQGKRYSHIVDPSSGSGKVNSSIITLSAPTATLADALATTLTVAPEKVKMKMIKKYGIKIID